MYSHKEHQALHEDHDEADIPSQSGWLSFSILRNPTSFPFYTSKHCIFLFLLPYSCFTLWHLRYICLMTMTRKDHIRQQAARLFRKKGYRATSMRDIAEAVGIKAASIYNHFSSKQEILTDLLLMVAQLFTNGMEDIKGSSASGEKKLRLLISLHIRLTADHTDAISLIAGEWVHLDQPAREQYLQLRDEYEHDFKATLEEGKECCAFRDLDTDIVLFSILSTLRWLYSWYSRNKSCNLVDLEQQMTEVLIEGVKKR